MKVKPTLRELLDRGKMTHRELAYHVKGRDTPKYRNQAKRVCYYLRNHDDIEVVDVLPSGEYVLALTDHGRRRAEYLKKKGEI